MKRLRALLVLGVSLLFVTSANSQQATAPSSAGGISAATRSLTEQRSEAHRNHLTPAQQTLKTFHAMVVYSDTVYLDTKVLQNALMKRFEIHAWKIGLGEKDSADVCVKVWRPTFTFDWRYRMTERASGRELGAGRIVAWDGKRAADALADDIARAIGRVRPLPTDLLAALRDEPNARKWELKYHDGSEGPRRGANLTVSVSSERIVGRNQSRVLFVIPARYISGASYNSRTTDASERWEAFWSSPLSHVGGDGQLTPEPGGGVDNPGAEAGIVLLSTALVGDILLKQFKSTEHFCEIAWLDNGTVRNVILRSEDPKRVQEFLAAVEELSHHTATDMEAEAAALRDAVERANREGRFVPVQLDRVTAVGWKILKPGAYRVVVAEREPKRAIAYFMPDAGTGPLQLETIAAAQIPVTIEAPVSGPATPSVRYREANDLVSIEEIATTDKTLHFRAIPLRFATEPQISEDMENLLAEAALKPNYRSVHVKSGTVYLKREVMEQALGQHPAFIEWEVKVVPRPEDADLALVVTRPFLTFDWQYVVTEVKTGKQVVEGKITARDGGRAATLIADQLVNALKAHAAQEMRNEVQ
jgi:hypothetical protein